MTPNQPNLAMVLALPRLPDQIKVEHGCPELLGHFFLAADRAARDRGVYLRLRHDLDGLVARYSYRRIEPALDWRASLKGDIRMAIVSTPQAELDAEAFLSCAIEDVTRPQHRNARHEAVPV